ncbi:MAG: hypothetical protein JO111_00915 [Caulobacteraceae bacterium]|nr:hypothetical protein [Caulobacteraceae bacterium]
MRVIVCPHADVADCIAAEAPARLISLCSAEGPEPLAWTGGPQLILRFHDIEEPRPDFVAPDAAAIDRLLAFGADWREEGPLLVHCWFGISRSTAAAFILLCAADPDRPETQIAQSLRDAAPEASPNRLMVALADERLRRGGRMRQAIADIGRGRLASTGRPFVLPVNRSAVEARERR